MPKKEQGKLSEYEGRNKMNTADKVLSFIAGVTFMTGIIFLLIICRVLVPWYATGAYLGEFECAEYKDVPECEYSEKTGQESATTLLIENVKLTAYCKEPYNHTCNDGNWNDTATMTTPTVGRTIAVDPKVIPHGAKVTINGKIYVAEDSGGWIKGNRIDILFETHKEALEFGVQYADVIVEV